MGEREGERGRRKKGEGEEEKGERGYGYHEPESLVHFPKPFLSKVRFTARCSPILLVTISLPVLLPLPGASSSSRLVLMLSALWGSLSSSWSRWLGYVLREPPLLGVRQTLPLYPLALLLLLSCC